ncbi:MAG TPA: formate dehydrogenase subunit alpha [Verrucomicrobiota bacterium]|nr:formate dehydrogenase subunit alpha [Verrucomicrobiota bacterium]
MIINGQTIEVVVGDSVLAACHRAKVEVPTLCHDDRLEPAAVCRLCLVHVAGLGHLVPACATPAAEGMQVETHTPEIEETRRTVLELLAKDYPSDEIERWPDKPFHRWLRIYGIKPGLRKLASLRSERELANQRIPSDFRDTTHPYLAADLSRCIDCFRCVRICDELQGQFVWHVTGPGNNARIVPDGPTLLTSSCVSCGACVDTCPTGALEDQSLLQRGTPTKWTRTTCPYCGVGCEMNVGTRSDRIVQVKPVLDAAVSKGHLCVKGRYAFDFTHSPDRVTEPMIREHSQWRTVSWSEATEFVAENFRRILKETGSDSIGVLGSARGTNEENYLAQKFARVVLGTNNVDCCARVCHAPTAAGMKQMLGTGAATNSFDDIEHAAAFLICGCNPTENHPIVGARIKQAVLRGAKLFIIDPRETELTHYAAVHLQLRPGTNVPLLHALAHVIVTEGLTDGTALRERVSDFEAYHEFISAWTPERSAAITGVSADLIRQAARSYATEKPAMCFHGLGVTEHVQGTEGVMCLVNLALLTGNFGRLGSGVNPLRGQNNVQGSAHMGCEPGNLTGFVPLDQGRDAFEATWQATVPRAPGLNLMQMIDAAADQKLKALWAIGYDVALTNPNTVATKSALSNLDFIVVQDLFLNELAREFGHVFLPACSSFEKDGTFMNSERRVQRVRQALEPLGHSKPDWEIICEVAAAMGAQNQFNFHSAGEIWDEVRAVWRAGAGISYARLERGGLQWPCPSLDHPGTTILHTTTFPTGPRSPLQRIEFFATTEEPTAEFPFLLTTGRTLYQFNAGTMTMRTPNSQLRATDTLDMAPADAHRLALQDGDRVRVRSRHGEATIPVRLDARVKSGELFATFHATEVFLNQLTSAQRDRVVMTPEYKVVAVSVEHVSDNASRLEG